MKEVLKKIGRDIWAYFACILFVILAWSWVFSYLTMIKTEEKVSVFIGSYSTSFEKTADLNENKPEYLKLVEVNAYSLKDDMFATYLSVFGLEMGDILILPESKLGKESEEIANVCARYFAPVSVSYQAEFSNLGFYTAGTEAKAYGIKVHDKETHKSLISCLNFGEGEEEENYYLFFNKKSVHLSDLSDSGQKTDMNGAIEVAKRLLSL